MGKKHDMFDWNWDGKVDWKDAVFFNEVVDDDENDSPPKNVRWTSKDTEIAGNCLGTVIGFLLFMWVIAQFL